MKFRILITVVVAVGCLLIAGCSSSGSSNSSSSSNSSNSSSKLATPVSLPTATPTKVPTTGSVAVQVDMTDKKIGFDVTTLKVGTLYSFAIRDKGMFAHDFVIVPKGERDAKNALFKIDNIEVGKTILAEYTFTKAGEYDVISSLPGDYDSGMKATITVQ